LTGPTYVKRIDSPGYHCPDHNGNSGPCPSSLGYTEGGRSTILVTAIGEESFVDRNGNGIFDQEEADAQLFQNLPEAFIDNNEDGVYTPALPACQASPMGSPQCIAGLEETFVDFNNNQTYDLNNDPAVYNGLLCPPEGNGVWCSRTLVNVRAQTVVILSASDTWDIILVRHDGVVVERTADGVDYAAYISDIFNNAPPAGSKVTVSASGDCKIASATSFDVPNSAAPGAFGIPVVTTSEDPFTDGSITIKLQPKSGAPYSENFSCGEFTDCSLSPKPAACPP
jgi:hypothetical protein